MENDRSLSVAIETRRLLFERGKGSRGEWWEWRDRVQPV